MGQHGAEPETGGTVLAGNRSLNNRSSLIMRRGAMRPGAIGAGISALALAAPAILHSATVSAPALRAALEMMMTLFALAAAWLLRAQFTSSRRLGDLELLAATLGLGLITFAVGALPAAIHLGGDARFAAAQLWGRLFVGVMFALAAFTPADSLVARRRHPLAITVGISAAGLGVAGLGGLLSGTHGTTLSVTSSHPVLVVVVLSATSLLGYAGVGFAHRYRLETDGVAGLVALSMIFLAGASFAYLLAGSLVPGRIGVGEGIRTVAFALILVSAVIRERQVHTRMSKASALAERRRVARDLHDGIAQDLAFIAAHGPRFVEELGDDHPVVVAARRALAISRSTISELSDMDGATVHESLEAVARELGDRFGISVAVSALLDRDLESYERENVTRIVREAIANAARHGGAKHVIVSLRHTDSRLALRVVDDGCGIAGTGRFPAPEGFGLRSMRERAAALGGQLNVRQPRRGGTELEVVLP